MSDNPCTEFAGKQSQYLDGNQVEPAEDPQGKRKTIVRRRAARDPSGTFVNLDPQKRPTQEEKSAPGERKPNPIPATGERKPNPPRATGDREPNQQKNSRSLNIPTRNHNYDETPGMEYEECRHLLPKGLSYVPDFITRKEEHDLLQFIDSRRWNDDLGRRTQQDGYKFNYGTEQLEPLPTPHDQIPKEFGEVFGRMREQGYPHQVDQTIINEYVGRQGIGAHIDLDPEFKEAVGSISLNGWCTMVFHPGAHTRAKEAIKLFLAPRSLLILEGEARHDWAHSIPKTRWDVDTRGKWWSRTRRVSITVRGVNGVPAPTPATSTTGSDRGERNPQKMATATDKTSPNETNPAPTYGEVLRRNREPQTPAREPRESQETLANQPEPRRGEGNTGKEGEKEEREIGPSKGRQARHQEEKDKGKGTGKEEGRKRPQPPPNHPQKGKGKGEGSREPPTGKGKGKQGRHAGHSTNPWEPLAGKGSKGRNKVKDGNQTQTANNKSDMRPRRLLVGSTVKQGKTDEGSPHSDDRQQQPTQQQQTNQNSNTEPSQSGGMRDPKGPQETTRHRAQRGGGWIHICARMIHSVWLCFPFPNPKS